MYSLCLSGAGRHFFNHLRGDRFGQGEAEPAPCRSQFSTATNVSGEILRRRGQDALLELHARKIESLGRKLAGRRKSVRGRS